MTYACCTYGVYVIHIHNIYKIPYIYLYMLYIYICHIYIIYDIYIHRYIYIQHIQDTIYIYMTYMYIHIHDIYSIYTRHQYTTPYQYIHKTPSQTCIINITYIICIKIACQYISIYPQDTPIDTTFVVVCGVWCAVYTHILP